jgi:hypothetical protein
MGKPSFRGYNPWAEEAEPAQLRRRKKKAWISLSLSAPLDLDFAFGLADPAYCKTRQDKTGLKAEARWLVGGDINSLEPSPVFPSSMLSMPWSI